MQGRSPDLRVGIWSSMSAQQAQQAQPDSPDHVARGCKPAGSPGARRTSTTLVLAIRCRAAPPPKRAPKESREDLSGPVSSAIPSAALQPL